MEKTTKNNGETLTMVFHPSMVRKMFSEASDEEVIALLEEYSAGMYGVRL